MTVTLRHARKHRVCDTYGPPAHPIVPGELYLRHVTLPGREGNEDGTRPVVHHECSHCVDERAAKWVRAQYGVPARLGARVTFDGQPGRIVNFRGGSLIVRLDTGATVPIHPTWNVTYEDTQDPEPVGA